MANNQVNEDLKNALSELSTWQLTQELKQIVQIKMELTTQKLSPVECDPDTGYSFQTICEYENVILKEIRSRRDKTISKKINVN